jgi:hypothetical protein
MTGGATEGFNLSVAENALVNAANDTTIIAGKGAGIAMRMGELGLHDVAFFPSNPSQGASFRDAFEQIVSIRESAPGELHRRKEKLVANLRTRQDSVLQGGEELLRD